MNYLASEKKTSVMKASASRVYITSIILFLTIMSSLLSYGQNRLRGMYTYSDDFWGFSIEFVDDFNYQYCQWTDLLVWSGKGRYELNSHMLVLTFDSSKRMHELSVHPCETENKDSVLVKFEILDPYLPGGLPGVIIIFKKEKELRIPDFGKVTDLEGKAEFILPKSDAPLFVTVSYVGFKKTQIQVIPKQCIDVKIQLKYDYIIEDAVFNYHIISASKKGLIMYNADKSDTIILKRKRYCFPFVQKHSLPVKKHRN